MLHKTFPNVNDISVITNACHLKEKKILSIYVQFFTDKTCIIDRKKHIAVSIS